MQKSYVPDGWLGIILGSKIYVNFIKNPFDECIRKLEFEIQNHIRQRKAAYMDQVETDNTNRLISKVGVESRVEKWSKEVIIY
jgi:hypothetical protein